MIFHENRLLADDSHETSYLIFFLKLGKMSQNLSSAAVVIRVNNFLLLPPLLVNFCLPLKKFANSLDPDQNRQNISPDLDPNCLIP